MNTSSLEEVHTKMLEGLQYYFMPTKGGVVGQFSEERVHERGLIAANSGEAIQKKD